MSAVQIHSIYSKNHRFETTITPATLTQWQPTVNLQVNPRFERLQDGRYEVVLAAQITGEEKGQRLFQLYLEQAGLFTLENIAAEQCEAILYGDCANRLFPYIEVLANQMLTQAALPQIYLQKLDFVSLYREHQRRQAAAAQQSESFTVSSSYKQRTLH